MGVACQVQAYKIATFFCFPLFVSFTYTITQLKHTYGDATLSAIYISKPSLQNYFLHHTYGFAILGAAYNCKL